LSSGNRRAWGRGLPDKTLELGRMGGVHHNAILPSRCEEFLRDPGRLFGQPFPMIVPRLLFPSAPEPAAPAEKFEELLGRLEQIVSDLETADLPLEKLLASYEEGMRLVKACGDRLADAEQKVEILSRSLADSAKAAAPSDSTTGKDDIRLF
jgi:exodeoxyribonuclease VII small subunit